jgi:hypothetical protein
MMAGIGRVGMGIGEIYPIEADVEDGIFYGREATFEGELAVGDIPAVQFVLEGHTSGGNPGTLALPTEPQVLNGVDYGVGGNGSTGSLTGGGGVGGYRARYKG